MTVRMGIGFDSHRFAAGRALILGGVRIEHERGLAGHSDADVLCHAVADALLGAVALGDIGRHFPDTDPAWQDASSLDLLRRVAELVRRAGGAVAAVDSTVIAEKPVLAPYIERMRERIAEAAALDVARVSVKAKTAEGMGALGRREGIAALAVATVEKRFRAAAGTRRRRKAGGRG